MTKGLSDEMRDFSHEAPWSGKVVLKRHAFLAHAGSLDQRVFFIEKGSFRVIYDDASTTHTIRLGYPGNWITLLDSFLQQQASVYAIQALKQSEVRFMEGVAFKAWIETDIHRRNWWSQLLEALVLQLMEREIDLLTRSPRERFQRILQRSPQLFQHIPHKYIADYLRMSAETLSRLQRQVSSAE